MLCAVYLQCLKGLLAFIKKWETPSVKHGQVNPATSLKRYQAYLDIIYNLNLSGCSKQHLHILN